MNLVINGKQVQLEEGITTIPDVMKYFNIVDQVVIIEHNGEILHNTSPERKIVDGDKLEFVKFVGGG